MRVGDDDAEKDPRRTASVGVVLAGRYRLGRQLGEGAMGIVWQAEAPGIGVVALRLLRPRRDVTSNVVERFRRGLARSSPRRADPRRGRLRARPPSS